MSTPLPSKTKGTLVRWIKRGVGMLQLWTNSTAARLDGPVDCAQYEGTI